MPAAAFSRTSSLSTSATLLSDEASVEAASSTAEAHRTTGERMKCNCGHGACVIVLTHCRGASRSSVAVAVRPEVEASRLHRCRRDIININTTQGAEPAGTVQSLEASRRQKGTLATTLHVTVVSNRTW